MKSFSTFAIAITLFVLCIIEKEAKQRDLEAQRLQRQSSDEAYLVSPTLSSPAYADLQSGNYNFKAEKFQLSELTLSSTASNTLEPTPFLGKLPLLNSLFAENNVN